MTISVDELRTQFLEKINFVNGPSNDGLGSVAMAAIVIWQARVQGANRQQIESLFTFNSIGALSRGRFTRAMGIARVWEQKGLPESVRAANSIDAAHRAAINWLGNQGVHSQDSLGYWFMGKNPSEAVENQVQRVARTIAGAIRGKHGWGPDFEPKDFAEAIITRLSDEEAEAFYRATVDAFIVRLRSLEPGKKW